MIIDYTAYYRPGEKKLNFNQYTKTSRQVMISCFV